VHLDRARADEQGLADLPAGIAPGDQQHDLHLAAGQADRPCPASGRAKPRLVAKLAKRRGAGGAQRAGTEPVGGVVGRVQQVPRQRLLAGLPGCGGGTELGLGRGQRQVQVAEHGGRPDRRDSLPGLPAELVRQGQPTLATR